MTKSSAKLKWLSILPSTLIPFFFQFSVLKNSSNASVKSFGKIVSFCLTPVSILSFFVVVISFNLIIILAV